jgi:ElaB/YqjD/DUF883 family membrane-anchored ribosome-binding protein
MPTPKTDEEGFSDDDVEEIFDMKAPKALIAEFEAIVKERPLLTAGLIFAFGLLLGASLSSKRRKSR